MTDDYELDQIKSTYKLISFFAIMGFSIAGGTLVGLILLASWVLPH